MADREVLGPFGGLGGEECVDRGVAGVGAGGVVEAEQPLEFGSGRQPQPADRRARGLGDLAQEMDQVAEEPFGERRVVHVLVAVRVQYQTVGRGLAGEDQIGAGPAAGGPVDDAHHLRRRGGRCVRGVGEGGEAGRHRAQVLRRGRGGRHGDDERGVGVLRCPCRPSHADAEGGAVAVLPGEEQGRREDELRAAPGEFRGQSAATAEREPGRDIVLFRKHIPDDHFPHHS